MAKVIRYYLKTADKDGVEVRGAEASIPYSEGNLSVAEKEAYGEITVEDNGTPEPEATLSTEERLSAVETKFAAMEAAYGEGVAEA